MKSILLVDYDNTLFRDEDSLYNNMKAIDNFRKNGNKLGIVTGRQYVSIKREINKYNIKYDYLSCLDGLELLGEGYSLVKYPLTARVSQLLDKHFIGNYKIIYDKSKKSVMECMYNITKVDYKDEYVEDLKNVLVKIKSVCLSRFSNSRGDTFVSVRSNGISKMTAGYDIGFIENSENIFAIGDNDNDIEMVKEFNGFCMKDSVQSLKSVALGEYESVSKLISDIEKKKVLVR